MNKTKVIVLGTMWVAIGVIGTFAIMHDMPNLVGISVFLGAVTTMNFN